MKDKELHSLSSVLSLTIIPLCLQTNEKDEKVKEKDDELHSLSSSSSSLLVITHYQFLLTNSLPLSPSFGKKSVGSLESISLFFESISSNFYKVFLQILKEISFQDRVIKQFVGNWRSLLTDLDISKVGLSE